MKKKNQRYTPEFKAEAVKLVTEQGLSQEAAALRRLTSGNDGKTESLSAKLVVPLENTLDQFTEFCLPMVA